MPDKNEGALMIQRTLEQLIIEDIDDRSNYHKLECFNMLLWDVPNDMITKKNFSTIFHEAEIIISNFCGNYAAKTSEAKNCPLEEKKNKIVAQAIQGTIKAFITICYEHENLIAAWRLLSQVVKSIIEQYITEMTWKYGIQELKTNYVTYITSINPKLCLNHTQHLWAHAINLLKFQVPVDEKAQYIEVLRQYADSAENSFLKTFFLQEIHEMGGGPIL